MHCPTSIKLGKILWCLKTKDTVSFARSSEHHNSPYERSINILLCPGPRREGGNKRCFCPPVRSSVCPSVAYIANDSRTQRPTVPKFGRKVPHLWCNSHISFKVKQSKIRVTRAINADTHRAPYLPNGKTYELQTWYAGGGWWPVSATGAMTSKVKDQGRKVTRSVGAVLAQWPINPKRIVVVYPKFALGTTVLALDKVPRRVWPIIAVTSKVKGQGHKLTSSVHLIFAST